MDQRKRGYERVNSFNKIAYDRITIMPPKGSKQRIIAAASERGMSMSEFIIACLPRKVIGEWRREKRQREKVQKEEIS